MNIFEASHKVPEFHLLEFYQCDSASLWMLTMYEVDLSIHMLEVRSNSFGKYCPIGMLYVDQSRLNVCEVNEATSLPMHTSL